MSSTGPLRKPPHDEEGLYTEEGPYDSGLLDSVTSSMQSLTSIPSPGVWRDSRRGDDEKKGEGTEQERIDSAYGSSSITDSLLASCTEEREVEPGPGDPEKAATEPEEPEAEDPQVLPDPETSRQLLQALAYVSEDGDTLLHLAIIHEALSLALDLISIFPVEMVEFQNNLFQTPLHLAVYLDQTEATRALVLKGVNRELQDRNGNTPLHVACEEQRLECAQILLQETGQPESSRNSQDLQLQNWQGLACLHIAALRKSPPLVSLLLKRNANINVKDGTSGKTPLHLAVELQDRELVGYLLRHGAQVDAAMYNGCTPLHLAVGRKDAAIASMLCQSGADTLLRNMEDETAQDLADGNYDILALLPFDDLKISGKPVVCSE